MRQAPTDAENLMWGRLRARRLNGHKFRRQMPIDRYIVDFACFESKLVVELDGGQHHEQSAYDESRTLLINNAGYRVLRFWNNDVFENLEGVLSTILEYLEGEISMKSFKPPPNPLLKEGEQRSVTPPTGEGTVSPPASS